MTTTAEPTRVDSGHAESYPAGVSAERVAAGLQGVQRRRARDTAAQAELVLDLAAERPAYDHGRTSHRRHRHGPRTRRRSRLGAVTTVVLLRHGRTTANTAGVLAGWTP